MASKPRKKIETVDQIEAAYGGIKPTATAFKMSVAKNGNGVSNWKAKGEVPPGRHLGLYLGLLARGYEPTPKLFGVVKWSDIPGVGRDSKRPPRGSLSK